RGRIVTKVVTCVVRHKTRNPLTRTTYCDRMCQFCSARGNALGWEGNMIGRQLRLLLFVLAVFALGLSFAQAPTGTVAGVLTDASGATVANAPVSITNKETGITRSVLTASDGAFSAPSLAAGVYTVKVAMTGFSTMQREATVETGGTTTVDLRLQV